jgi:hypothetical protein
MPQYTAPQHNNKKGGKTLKYSCFSSQYKKMKSLVDIKIWASLMGKKEITSIVSFALNFC